MRGQDAKDRFAALVQETLVSSVYQGAALCNFDHYLYGTAFQSGRFWFFLFPLIILANYAILSELCPFVGKSRKHALLVVAASLLVVSLPKSDAGIWYLYSFFSGACMYFIVPAVCSLLIKGKIALPPAMERASGYLLMLFNVLFLSAIIVQLTNPDISIWENNTIAGYFRTKICLTISAWWLVTNISRKSFNAVSAFNTVFTLLAMSLLYFGIKARFNACLLPFFALALSWVYSDSEKADTAMLLSFLAAALMGSLLLPEHYALSDVLGFRFQFIIILGAFFILISSLKLKNWPYHVSWEDIYKFMTLMSILIAVAVLIIPSTRRTDFVFSLLLAVPFTMPLLRCHNKWRYMSLLSVVVSMIALAFNANFLYSDNPLHYAATWVFLLLFLTRLLTMVRINVSSNSKIIPAVLLCLSYIFIIGFGSFMWTCRVLQGV